VDSTDQRDITGACMIAMAKIGKDHPKFDLLPVLTKRLVTFDQEIRETAALAMGISQMPAAIQPLRHLALGDEEGRKLVEKASVDVRTRSFAVYGMGLIAYATNDIVVKQTTLETAAKILRNDSIMDRNVLVAAVNAIGLLNADRQQEGDPKSLINKALDELDHFYAKKLGRGRELIQSHVPPAVSKLLGRGTEGRRKAYKELYRKELTSGKKRSNDVYRAAAIGLGQLALSAETDSKDSKYSKALLDYFRKGKDQQARYYALMSLGQIGGNANSSELLKVLRKGKKALERPWAALSLGVMSFHKFEADESAKVDITIGDAIMKQFREVKTPQSRSAFAIALGLVRYRDAAGELVSTLLEKKHQDEFAGYLCIGLALMDYRKAKPQIHDICRNAVRRADLLQQAAVALGKLGDRSVTDTLTKMLSEETGNLAKLSALAGALGFIGDRRTIKPLVKMLFNEQLTPLSRAFAAVALGGVADKEPLPWNSKIARNMNYRAVVETLTGAGTGVLDIL
jgi:HEAT repeat protein